MSPVSERVSELVVVENAAKISLSASGSISLLSIVETCAEERE